ncbi:hypothetical protein ES705_37959 [subsurface metagenome]
MTLLGPTTFVQQNPELPDAYDYFERESAGDAWQFPSGGAWQIKESGFLTQDTVINGQENWFKAILDSTSADDFIAEFNMKEVYKDNNEAKYGAVFSYSDEANYGIALLNSYTNSLEISFLSDDVWGTPTIAVLPVELDFSRWHSIKIERFNTQYKFFVDGLFMDSLTHDAEGGKIGYLASWCQTDFGFLAFSNKSNGSGTFDVYKPVPGILASVQYNRGGEGTGYHKENPSGNIRNLIRTDEVELVETSLGGYGLASVETGDWFAYNINVEQDYSYNIEVTYATGLSDCRIRFSSDGTHLSDPVDLPSTGGMEPGDHS